jgi:hypothetical protein
MSAKDGKSERGREGERRISREGRGGGEGRGEKREAEG